MFVVFPDSNNTVHRSEGLTRRTSACEVPCRAVYELLWVVDLGEMRAGRRVSAHWSSFSTVSGCNTDWAADWLLLSLSPSESRPCTRSSTPSSDSLFRSILPERLSISVDK